MIAQSAASAPLLLKKRQEDIDEHDVLNLLSMPADGQGGFALFEAYYAYLLLAGNTYLEAVGPDNKPPRELWNLRPDRMQVIPGSDALPKGYEYKANGKKITWRVDAFGRSPILHMREFHPLNDWYGLSAVEPAAFSVDRHNAAGEHNTSLLQNGARIPGVLAFKSIKVDGKTFSASKEIIKDAEKKLEERHQGTGNAGRPLVVSGDVDWKATGFSPVDMDFNEGKLDAARDICISFGVPHILIVPGASTFNNVREARLELYEQTILPILEKSCAHLNAWLLPQFGDGLRLSVDLDGIPALALRRELKQDAVSKLYDRGLLTRDEARGELKYEPLPELPAVKPDPAILTTLQNGVDKGNIPIEAMFRYMRAVGLLPKDAKDEDLLGGLLNQMTSSDDEELVN